ncbi:DUF4136 domain-containing protein [Mesonia sediminis]|uniref:DUF4136 domain-containing protein n=1 Tax=Mesonia sediminis TaxID=1703946 RepID=A0ABW5SB42_9FLAO
MTRILSLVFCLFLMSCGPKVYVDYDAKVNFQNYRTYQFYPQHNIAADHLNELDQERLIKAVEDLLAQQGYVKSSNPDFKILLETDVFQQRNNSQIGIGFGGGGGHVGGGVSGGIPISTTKTILSLSLNFSQAQTNELFWQAVVEDHYKRQMNPKEKQVFFNRLISKGVKEFPPK